MNFLEEKPDENTMSQQAKKFHHRAPRYVIQPKDEKFLRFAHENDKQRTYTTQIINISESGLAFVVDKDCVPQIGDTIKVEFPVGNERVAWFAKVMRLESFDNQPWWKTQREAASVPSDEEVEEDEVLVGIQFQDLPEGHSEQIQKELEKKFLDMVRAEKKEKIIRSFEFVTNNYWALLLYGVTAILMAGILYWLANPFY